MIRPSRLLPVLLCAAASCAGAAEPLPPAPTYRIVGPDGKVTYSDRMPTDPKLRTRELGQRVVAPLVAPAAGPFDLRPQTTPPPLPPLEAGTVPALDISGKPFPPGLPDAIVTVLVHQFFVQTLVESCTRLQPATAERYQIGVRNWRDRNGDILGRSNHITFTRFTGEQRDTLRATARQRLATVSPSPSATDDEKIGWCEHMSGDLVRRQFELVGDVRVAPILYFVEPS